MPGTVVIIPFFQREAGVLAAAIRSALSQRDAGPLTIMVCDDGSPISADEELAALTAMERERVVLLRQENAGAGAARNAALDAMPPCTEWIAFLDSDDRWGPDHIARSVAALEEGHDLCFGDTRRTSQVLTHFQGAAFEPSEHLPIGVLPGMFRFVGNFLTLNIALSPVSISTVVMRASALGDLRFPTMAFEDLVYWFEAARRPIRVAFDATLQVHYGRGNITLAESWKSPGALRVCLMYHRVFMRVSRGFKLTPVQRAILDERMARNRQSFAATALGLLRDGKAPAWRVMASFLTLDPWVCCAIIGTTASETAQRLFSSPASINKAASVPD